MSGSGMQMSEVEKPPSFRQQVRVRWVDTDASRRIHYTAMFRFFEVAESEFMRSLGFTSARFREMGLDLPRVHVSCDFKVPILHDELLQMGVSVEREWKLRRSASATSPKRRTAQPPPRAE